MRRNGCPRWAKSALCAAPSRPTRVGGRSDRDEQREPRRKVSAPPFGTSSNRAQPYSAGFFVLLEECLNELGDEILLAAG